MTTIKLKNGSGAPTAGDLVQGEPALDLTNKRLYTEDSGGTVIEVGTNPTSVTTGAITATGIDVTGTVTADGLTVDGSAVVRSGNTLTLNRTDNAIGGAMSYVAGTGFIFNDANGDGTSFNVGAANRMRIDSSGNVGIGTSSVSAQLHLQNGSTEDVSGSTIRMDLSGINPYWEVQARNGGSAANRQLGFYTSATSGDVLTLTQAGNVGIGTSSPTGNLVVVNSGGGGLNIGYNATSVNYYDADTQIFRSGSFTERMRIDSSGTAMFKGGTTDNAIQIWESNSEIARIGGSSGTLNFLVGSTTDSRLSITSAGNVGIGTSSPSGPFHIATGDSAVSRVVGTSASGTNFGIGNTSTGPAQLIIDGSNGDFAGGDYVTLRQNNDLTGELVNVGPNALLFSTSNDEKMRIDSSGNLLVGTTQTATQLAATSSEEGMAIDNGGLVAIANSGQSPLVLNRLSSDGNIINFHRDGGTPVGSIGTHLSRIHMSAGDAGLFLDGGGTPAIWPWKSTATTSGDADAEITLGDSSNRFKDLYLSGQWVSNGSNNTVRASFQVSGTQYGYINVATTGTLYSTSSDYRLKENVVALTNATERLKQLNPLRFSFIPDQANTIVDGFLAHEVADIVPEAILGEKDAIDDDGNPVYQGIDQSKLVPLLVATIQELEARIAALESN